jgi:hypothetical protein
MPTVAQPLRTARAAKNGPQTFGSSRKKNKMASVGISSTSCTTIGISQASQRDIPTDLSRLATIGEVDDTGRQSYRQNRTVLYRAILCVNQWEEEKYLSLFRYWLKLKGTLQMSL